MEDLKQTTLPLIAALVLTAPFSYAGTDKLTVMTRNVYLGADIFKVVEAAMTDPTTVPLAVTAAFQEVQQTDFTERAEALAVEIKRYRPDAIGLQEVSIFYTQTPSDFGYAAQGYPERAADTVYIDYLSVLQAALEARGLHYTVAASVTNADIEVPMVTGVSDSGPLLSDLRMVDHDVILVSRKTMASNPLTGNYTYNAAVDVAGSSLEFTRGYAAVDITVKGDTYRFVNTHLETGGSEPFKSLQAVQMTELLGIMDMTNTNGIPTILVGDFNSAPGEDAFVSASGIPGLDGLALVPPYLQAVASGYADAWLEQKRPGAGLTCCFSSTVNGPDSELSERIDHIFLAAPERTRVKVQAKVVGDDVFDMTPGGLWPSDHAGVVARIMLKSRGR
ncbi:endonuclease/exonuclease/phosphatase family protein [Allohahella marinimesophila]|uniref:Endonuclease/exonuclease/phosphatase domain-containing protein n=1 Tax=Allohahella marinimesophila TaxID=1054972 RepID=A0ABP7NX46_9GAMM